MKKLNSSLFISVIAVIMVLFTSCTGNASFSAEEIRFTKPFEHNGVVVFKSAMGHMDTVKFLKREIDTIRYRNIEQGFYNENVLAVGYELTGNSYHKLTVQSINKDPEHFLLFLKAKNSHSAKEISFLGLIFDDDYVNNKLNTKDSSIVFSRENARYEGVNINEGIKSFRFDFGKGVVSFVDKNGVEWVRLN